MPKFSAKTIHPIISGNPSRRVLFKEDGTTVDPHVVFGTDDRQIYIPDGYPNQCVGRLIIRDFDGGGTSFGTAALVGTNMILTAGHAIPWDSNSFSIEFSPASFDGTSRLGRGVRSFANLVRGYDTRRLKKDMAILRLERSLGDTLGYFGVRQYHDEWRHGAYWTRCGYGIDIGSRGTRPNRVSWFPIIDEDGVGNFRQLEHRADSNQGDSGGPIFGWWSGVPYIVGVHVGADTDYHFPFRTRQNNVGAGGAGIVDLVRWGRENW